MLYVTEGTYGEVNNNYDRLEGALFNSTCENKCEIYRGENKSVH